uniref:NYN domain-containing protein n=1 Tax=Kalanchoe fedtschenkoi TaxID=63787 RepID=A0A7N0UT93_KALFE
MLFWAVDNPAPANYLLISGDRDFSNALHQLRMRRYNILLAQPQKASAPLVAAAKSVWLWTNLILGGFPLSSGESSQLANISGTSNSVVPSSSFVPAIPPIASVSTGHNYNSSGAAMGNGNAGYSMKHVPKNANQPGLVRSVSMPGGSRENETVNHNRPEQTRPIQFKKAPHEFFVASRPVTTSSLNHSSSCQEFSSNNSSGAVAKPLTHQSLPLSSGNTPHSSAPPSNTYTNSNWPMPPSYNATSLPKKPIGYGPFPFAVNPRPNMQRTKKEANQNPQEPSLPVKLNTSTQSYNPYPNKQYVPVSFNGKFSGVQFLPPSTATTNSKTSAAQGVAGTQVLPQVPDCVVQGLIGVILLALNTLKSEKIAPTEANVFDCIKHDVDLKKKNIDTRKALDYALEHHMVEKRAAGALHVYVGRNDRLWNCVNPQGGKPDQYSVEDWNRIQEFLASPSGRSEIMAASCRYEAAQILRKACFEKLALGEVLQILAMICDIKKWIESSPSGWQPIHITLSSSESVSDSKVSS